MVAKCTFCRKIALVERAEGRLCIECGLDVAKFERIAAYLAGQRATSENLEDWYKSLASPVPLRPSYLDASVKVALDLDYMTALRESALAAQKEPLTPCQCVFQDGDRIETDPLCEVHTVYLAAEVNELRRKVEESRSHPRMQKAIKASRRKKEHSH